MGWPPPLGPYTLLFLLLHWADKALACIPTGLESPSAPSGSPSAGGGGSPATYAAKARGAPNLPLNPIGGNQLGSAVPNSQSVRAILGSRVVLTEFGSDGYNSQGGGPVPDGASLSCDFEGQPCCWANVPSPSEDQIDWVQVQGIPESAVLPRNLSADGKYLAAYATSAAPSDEAQLSSCAIACASSPIRVRARHWQSANVLLQVCQRESFPPSLGFNPLLNCQEFPTTMRMAYTELVLPKASYVDIVFVASNFIDDRGDIVFLDDIQILYDSNPPDCGAPATASSTTTHAPPPSTTKVRPTVPKKASTPKTRKGSGVKTIMEMDSHGKELDGDADAEQEAGVRRAEVVPQVDGGKSAAAGAAGTTGATVTVPDAQTASVAEVPDTSTSSPDADKEEESSAGAAGASAAGTSSAISAGSTDGEGFPVNNTAIELPPSIHGLPSIAASEACPKAQCSFEDGTICRFSDTFDTPGLTTRFEVVKGQFMNKVTGVKGGIEGNFYAAVFLYPREKAGLLATLGAPLAQPITMRFQFYEGTHGVQLKGCCDGTDQCPFHSDRFVSVADRMWKSAGFVCPRGTEKVMFLCENTRTNQGACAMDDIRVLDERGEQSLC